MFRLDRKCGWNLSRRSYPAVCTKACDVKISFWSKNQPLWSIQLTHAACRVVDKNAFVLKRVRIKFQHLSANSGTVAVVFGTIET